MYPSRWDKFGLLRGKVASPSSTPVGSMNERHDFASAQKPKLLRFMSATIVLFGSLVGAFVLGPFTPPAGASGSTFYVDCTNGNDNAAGTTAGTAWQSINRANQAQLNAGDSLLLKRGCSWSEQLRAHWNGTDSNPILIGAFGSGDLPKLQNTRNGDVQITGTYQTIENIQTYNSPGSYDRILASCSNQPVGWIVGFNFAGGSNNTLRNSLATHEALAVSLTGNASDNRIVNNQFINNDGAWEAPSSSQGLRGGTAIGLSGTGNEIANNHFENNATICGNESISIELYNASSSNIHNNTSFGDKDFIELGSGGTFVSSNNTIAYNVHSTSQAHSRFVVTRGQGDSHGPVWQTTLYNNVAYGSGSDSQGIICMSCGTNVLRMENNVIDVVTKALYVGGSSLVESNNIFWSPAGQPPKNNFVQNWSMSPTSRVVNPQFANPGNNNFHLQASSPAIDLGSSDSTKSGYKTDLDGNSVPQGGAVDVGSYEVTSTNLSSGGSSNAASLPGRVQAEDFNTGGEGVGYHDTTAGNLGSAYRNDGVDIQKCSDPSTPSGQQCYNVGWPVSGEWVAYDVNVSATGTFHISARVASIYGGRSFHVLVDGNNVTGSIAVPKTGDWQTWTTVTSKSFSLSSGTHTLKFVDESDGFNVNYFDVTN